MSTTLSYYTLNGLAKAARHTTPRLQRRLVELAVAPDAHVIQQGNPDMLLFREDRLPEILRALESNPTPKL